MIFAAQSRWKQPTSRGSWLSCLLLLVLSTGCRDERRVTHDFVALVPEALVSQETSLIDFGLEAVRDRLVAGFSADETAGDGTSFSWSEGESSVLRLFVGVPRTLSVTFRCWPFRFQGAPPQTLTLDVNGVEIQTLELAPEPGEYRVTLPEQFLVPGDNSLRLRYGYDRAPADVLPNARDERSLAVAWDWLRLEGALEARAPEARGESLAIPAGTSVEFFVQAVPKSMLVVDAVRPSLALSLETLSSRIERDFGGATQNIEIALPSDGKLTRISFRAGAEDAVLRKPVIVSSTPAAAPASAPRKRRPNVIVYLIDTLRADHLGCYGARPSVTPRIDAFAGESTLYEHAYAQSSWTKPSTASILTGRRPRAHTANHREDALPKEVPTLAEVLRDLGYETAGRVVNANVSAPFGFDRGFDTYELLLHEDGILGARADRLVDETIRWLGARNSNEPFFLYMHTTDPHDPYATTGFHGEGFGTVAFMESLEDGRRKLNTEELERLIAAYDEDVAFADAQFGRFIDWLKDERLYDESLIVLISDHGEEFADHGRWRHGKTLYREQLDVPLIIKWPGRAGAGERLGEPVQHIDLFPTIVDYLGGVPAVDLEGRSLWRLAEREASRGEEAVISYLSLDGREIESVIWRHRKLVHYVAYDRPVPAYQLFDLEHDRGEIRSLTEDEERVAGFLTAYLRYRAPKQVATPSRAVIDDDVERQLRALGYIR